VYSNVDINGRAWGLQYHTARRTRPICVSRRARSARDHRCAALQENV